jgi:hypothetical protein
VSGDGYELAELSASGEAAAARVTSKGPSQATVLVGLAADVELFATTRQDAYVTLQNGGHRETWPLRTKPFKIWLARRYYELNQAAPGSQALQDALAVLEGKALFEGPVHDVGVRVAEHDGAIYLDLADEHWQAIRIDRDGWEVVANPPVRFRRPAGMRELAAPVRGGSLDELRPFVNASKEDWPLLMGWELAAVRPRGPYPVLTLHGEQGTAKTTTVRVLRELVDPNEVDVRSQPREERDLMIAARNGHILAFDNLSFLPGWLSDGFCRIATGGVFATRILYSDFDEALFEAQRPLTMNGIAEIALNGDLLDRSLIIYLPRIPKRKRRLEEDLWAEFTPQRGRLVGALLDAVVVGLRRSERLELKEPPRMADFAHWVVACEPALGWPAQTFLAAYELNRGGVAALSLEASLLSTPIQLVAGIGFEGTATELLHRVEDYVDEETRRKKAWPKSPSALGGQLRRLAPSLRATGVIVDFGRTRERLIRLGTESAVDAVDAVEDDESKPFADDGGDGAVAVDDGTAVDAKPLFQAVCDGNDGNDGNDGKSRTQSKDLPEPGFGLDDDEIERLAIQAWETHADSDGVVAGVDAWEQFGLEDDRMRAEESEVGTDASGEGAEPDEEVVDIGEETLEEEWLARDGVWRSRETSPPLPGEVVDTRYGTPSPEDDLGFVEELF